METQVSQIDDESMLASISNAGIAIAAIAGAPSMQIRVFSQLPVISLTQQWTKQTSPRLLSLSLLDMEASIHLYFFCYGARPISLDAATLLIGSPKGFVPLLTLDIYEAH